jgi:hypothetical protein
MELDRHLDRLVAAMLDMETGQGVNSGSGRPEATVATPLGARLAASGRSRARRPSLHAGPPPAAEPNLGKVRFIYTEWVTVG